MSFSLVYHYQQAGRRFLCALLLVFMTGSAMAQEGKDEPVVVVDTTAPAAAPDEEEDMEEGEEETDQVVVVPDTPALRLVTDSIVHRLQQEKEFAYANDPAYWTKEPAENESGDRRYLGDYVDDFARNKTVQSIFYVLLVLALLFVVYRVMRDNQLFPRKGRKGTGADNEEGDVMLDEEALDKKIRQAIVDKEYRPATRFLYLKSLQSLDKKGWIRYHAEGTNNEYLNQVRQHGASNEFGFLTYIYDYVWYGEFTLTETQFSQVHQHFTNFHNTIRS